MFYDHWKNVTALEHRAIETLTRAQHIILEKIPDREIISLYVGGSFLRREMKPGSDLDIWVITKTASGQHSLSKLIKELEGTFQPPLGLSGYSLWELKQGKILTYLKDKPRTGPRRFVKKLPHYALLYGEKLDPARLRTNTDREDLTIMIKTFEREFIPKYADGQFDFQTILKQVFWLTDLELLVRGTHPPHSWTEIAKLTPPEHIARRALDYRHHPPSTAEESAFITVLKKYLAELRTL